MNNIFKSMISNFAYPLILISTVALHFMLIDIGWHLLSATYFPVIITAILITVLERTNPERNEWKPSGSELRLDTIYMGFVQILLPKLFTFLAVWMLINTMPSVQTEIWPQHLHPIIQVTIMLLAAEFLRYWLHRVAHEWPVLWRLHSIHHSPKLLYWLNVGRFHPLEKFLQFFTDILPFMLLGVSEEVIALYFVFYAVNGFFQHCNIRLNFGWLNFLFSTAELHRWHHSIDISEANKNYGNNLIVWDLLFGTWFLPTERKVGELGVKDADYSAGFISHCIAPFKSTTANQVK